MCANPRGLHEHVPLSPGEPMPETCFADCDCLPVEFISRERVFAALGWFSAELWLHGIPEFGPKWLELWDRAFEATEDHKDESDT